MKFTHEQYAQALYESLQEVKAKDHDTVINNFIQILKANGDLSEYEAIVDAVEKYDKEQRGIQEVEVTTAQKPQSQKAILDHLNKVVAGKVDLKQQIDDNLIGGAVIRVNDTLIDSSLKRQLENLENTLINPDV